MTPRTPIERRALQSMIAGLDWSLKALERLYHAIRRARRRCGVRLNHEPRDDDIYVVSYPKAGTTAMQMMLYQLTTAAGIDFPHIIKVVPWFEVAAQRPPHEQANGTGPRLYKTHLPFDGLPSKGRFIYMLRNPKDTCLSYYYHHLNNQPAGLTLEAFTRRFIAGEVPWGSWFDSLLQSLTNMGTRRVLIVDYDELAASPERVLNKVAEFCGYEISPAKREQILHYCSFAVMKSHNDKFDPSLAAGPLTKVDFIRTGVSGSWVDELTPSLAFLIDEKLVQTLREAPRSVITAHSDSLRGGVSSAKGTLVATVDDVAAIAEHGGTITFDDDSVKPGDVVRLKLSDSRANTLIVEQATVRSLQPRNGDTKPQMDWIRKSPELIGIREREHAARSSIAPGSG